MYSNNILNFQESMTILNACTKKSGNLLKAYVYSCVPCVEAPKNPPQILDSHLTYPEQPWFQIHVDYAGPINGLSFLVVVDAHSKLPEIFPMKNLDTHSTITILKQLLVSDNGTRFTSELF